MKKFNIFKIVQLSLLILITLISVYLLMQPEVKQYIFCINSRNDTVHHYLDRIICKLCISSD